jgi:hypothetical protein
MRAEIMGRAYALGGMVFLLPELGFDRFEPLLEGSHAAVRLGVGLLEGPRLDSQGLDGLVPIEDLAVEPWIAASGATGCRTGRAPLLDLRVGLWASAATRSTGALVEGEACCTSAAS